MLLAPSALLLTALLLRPARSNDVSYGNSTTTISAVIPTLIVPNPASNLSTTFVSYSSSDSSASATITSTNTATTTSSVDSNIVPSTMYQTLTASNGQLTTLTSVVAVAAGGGSTAGNGGGGAGASGTATPGVQTGGANGGRVRMEVGGVAVGLVAGCMAVLR